MFPREKKAFFAELGTLLGETGEAVRVKWNSLLTSYKRIKANNGKMTGRGTLEKWPFFDAMESLMGARPNISPVFIIESGENSRENRQPESPETPSSNTEKKTPVRKRRATSSEDYMQGKLELERQRLALEQKRLALEERRINILGDLVNHLKKQGCAVMVCATV